MHIGQRTDISSKVHDGINATNRLLSSVCVAQVTMLEFNSGGKSYTSLFGSDLVNNRDPVAFSMQHQSQPAADIPRSARNQDFSVFKIQLAHLFLLENPSDSYFT